MFMQIIFYQVSVKMHNRVTKGYYYKKDMKNLLAPNILDSIENFKKNIILCLIKKLKIISSMKYLKFK